MVLAIAALCSLWAPANGGTVPAPPLWPPVDGAQPMGIPVPPSVQAFAISDVNPSFDPVIGADGRVYCGLLANGSPGALAAYDGYNGSQIWITSQVYEDSYSMALDLYGKTLLVAGGSDGNRFTALDANTGNVRWSVLPVVMAGYDPGSVAVFAFDTVAVASGSGPSTSTVAGMDLSTGGVAWNITMADVDTVWAFIGAYAPSSIVLMLSTYEAGLSVSLVALNAHSGAEVWRVGPIFTTSWVGSVVSPSGVLIYVAPSRHQENDNLLVARNVETGDLIWNVTILGYEPEPLLVVRNEYVAVSNSESSTDSTPNLQVLALYSLNGGTLEASVELPDSVVASASGLQAWDNYGTVLFEVLGTGPPAAVSLPSGKVLFTLPGDFAAVGPHGLLYASTGDGTTLTAFTSPETCQSCTAGSTQAWCNVDNTCHTIGNAESPCTAPESVLSQKYCSADPADCVVQAGLDASVCAWYTQVTGSSDPMQWAGGDFLPENYQVAAQCACSGCGASGQATCDPYWALNPPIMSCVRTFLYEHHLALNATERVAVKQSPLSHASLFHGMHVEAYAACCCPGTVASEATWYGIFWAGKYLTCDASSTGILGAILDYGRCGDEW